jgi:hypothetical protein
MAVNGDQAREPALAACEDGRVADLLTQDLSEQSILSDGAGQRDRAMTELRLVVASPIELPAAAPEVEHDGAVVGDERGRGVMVALIACALLAAIGWRFSGVSGTCRPADLRQLDMASGLAAGSVAYRIIAAESSGDISAKNDLSSATGAGQFLDATWLDMIRAARPDLAALPDQDILDLRRDSDLSRDMVARFAKRNAAVLASRCLPVTPGTLYLSHFAGGAGAVAVLSARHYADAATTMAHADSTGRTTREMIVTANPFLAKFTVADLMRWADHKMGADEAP